MSVDEIDDRVRSRPGRTPLAGRAVDEPAARQAAGHADLHEAWPVARRARGHHVPRWVRRLTGPLLLLVGWQLLSSTGVVDERTLAAPSQVVQAGAELLRTGELQTHLAASLQRALLGLAIGITAGVVARGGRRPLPLG